MNPKLLDSQLATLETPDDAFRIVNDRLPDRIVDQIVKRLGLENLATHRFVTERGSDPMGHPLFDLSGKKAVVVGGTSGIGLAMAVGLAEAGADVVSSSRRQEQVDDAAALIEGRGRKAVSYTHLDVYKRQIFYISNPGLGLWAYEGRFKEQQPQEALCAT